LIVLVNFNLVINLSYIEKYLSNDHTPAKLLKKLKDTDTSNILDPTTEPTAAPTADPSSTPTADLWSPMPVAPVTHSNHDTIPHQVFYKPTIAPSTVAPASSSSSVPSSVTSSSSVPSTISPSDLLSVVPSVAAIGE